jgi:broad specificity phosphatase PhoE
VSDLQCAATLLLTEAGDGRAVGHSLGDRRIAAIYTSPHPAAVRTAEIVAAATGAGVAVHEDLREPLDESGTEVRARVARELTALADLHRGETVLVVSHLATLRAGVLPLVGRDADYAAAHPVPPGGVVEVAADADGWLLRSWAATD